MKNLWLAFTLVLCMVFAGFLQPAYAETLCILDFNRLGDDDSADWLRRGLSDMMITVMSRAGAYEVVDRAHLVATLREHGLLETGLVDEASALKQAQLVKAQLLLMGQFVRKDKEVSIQIRLLSLSDQQLVAMAEWHGPYDRILTAPERMSRQLLEKSGQKFDPGRYKGLETQIPTTIDVAEAYYKGLNAFDKGDYPRALSDFLSGTRVPGEFVKIHQEAVRLYALLNEPVHAMLSAMEAGRIFEKTDMRQSLDFYFSGAEKAAGVPALNAARETLLRKIIAFAERYEDKTGEANAARTFLRDKIWEVYQVQKKKNVPVYNWEVLRNDDIFYRMWIEEVEQQLEHRYPSGRDFYYVNHGGEWKPEPIPPLSVWMWKTRAQLDLARNLRDHNRYQEALQVYHAILEDYRFVDEQAEKAEQSEPRPRRISYRDDLTGAVLREATEGLIFRHYARDGELLREPWALPRTVEMKDGMTFIRGEETPVPDPRVFDGQSNPVAQTEEYRFITPLGYQIDHVTLDGTTNRLGWFNFLVFDPDSGDGGNSLRRKSLREIRSLNDSFHEQIDMPPGTQYLIFMTGGGSYFLQGPVEAARYALADHALPNDIKSWQISFTLSPLKTMPAAHRDAHDYTALDQRLIAEWALLNGWQGGEVIHDDEARYYGGQPKLDVYGMNWIVLSDGHDLNVYSEDDPGLKIRLPVTINSDDDEYNPSLVKTHDGTMALLWTRNNRDSKINAGSFVSFSDDFLQWSTPQRLDCAKVPEDFGKQKIWSALEQADGVDWQPPYEQTFNIFKAADGYVMLLPPGYIRRSKDLVSWGLPEKILHLDGNRFSSSTSREGVDFHNAARQATVTTPDGRIWVASLFDDREESSLATAFLPRWRHWPNRAEGKTYVQVNYLKITSTLDGKEWSKEILLPLDKYNIDNQAIWAFPVSDRQIAIVVDYMNHLQWVACNDPESCRPITGRVGPINAGFPEMQYYLKDKKLYCALPAPRSDWPARGLKGTLLLRYSSGMYDEILGGLR